MINSTKEIIKYKHGLSILLCIILLNKSIESQTLVTELLKILISGYLGYLIRISEEK
jgi:hypothetical protein